MKENQMRNWTKKEYDEIVKSVHENALEHGWYKPRKEMMKKTYTFIDLFAGIGGFHTAMHYVGGECVFASEWDKNARLSYEVNYKNIEPKLFKKDKDGKYLYFNEDINDAIPSQIPDFDICCGGFPC
ncbi:hypothetical protein PF672P1_00077 [Parabacteroides phage PF672P1]|nr:hypothetical protein PF672P1_00077 [Parabacteroides phage PF672P1]